MNKMKRLKGYKFIFILMSFTIVSFLIPKAYGMICSYVSDGGWTGELVGCYTHTYELSGEISGTGGGIGGTYSRSEEVCEYRAYDPYGVGHSGTKTYNSAIVDRC